MNNEININSSRDELYRCLRKIVKNQLGKQDGFLLVEGKRQIVSALKSGIKIKYLIYSQDKRGEDSLRAISGQVRVGGNLISMKPSLFEDLAETRSSQGVLLLSPMLEESLDLQSVFVQATAPILILENVQDPGNTGTLIRTADAFGFAAVVITVGGCQPYNGKALRASMGATFRIPLLTNVIVEDLLVELSAQNYTLYAADMDGQAIQKIDLAPSARTALLLGNEGAGISDLARQSSHLVSVPMLGDTESLNVAMAGTILCWEIYRRRIDSYKE